MLFEWLQYLATPCPKHLRAMGYPQEIIATQARYRRCGEAWRPHLENTKAFILESAAAARGHRSAVVLGSGMLLDVPLSELSQRFEQVILVDILHLPWVKLRARRYPNVRFVELDVTGVCKTLFEQVEQARSAKETLPMLPERCPTPLPQSLGLASVDFVVSVNLLSQLPLTFCAYLEKERADSGDQDLLRFSSALIVNHLQWLKAGADRVCLITDLERERQDSEGGQTAREDALCGVALPECDREWIWTIAPRPEIEPQSDFRHRVGGILDFR